MFEVLLADLRKTGGFTVNEIFSNILESGERRRALLNCLGIPNDEATTYEQLGQLIFDYQKSNCGAVQPVKVCYSLEILQCWGDEAVKDAVTQRQLNLSSDANMFEVLLADLSKTKGFTENEIFSNILEEEDRRRKLLNCLGIANDANTSYDQLGQLIIQYQNNNCQSTFQNPKVKVDTGALPVAELVKILEKRGVVKSGTETREELEKAVVSSSGGNELSEDELLVLSDNSIVNILDKKNISRTTSENKSQLIKKLFKRG